MMICKEAPKSYLESNGLRCRLLQGLYRLAPFDIKGDLVIDENIQPETAISCLICASIRPRELEALLDDLLLQDLAKDRYEVVVVNDGGGATIQNIVQKYAARMTIKYSENQTTQRHIGALRNITISLSRGKYILCLDDDSRIMQTDFLSRAVNLFESQKPDVIVPYGEALYGIVKLRYDFFDHFSFGNAGCLYTRDILCKTRGFKNDLQSYEDIELGIRLSILGATIFKTPDLVYFHPPFYFDSMKKPLSIGKSILKLRRHYSFFVWIAVFVNALRFLPYGVIPDLRYQQWFKISLGVLWSCFKKEEYYY